MSIIRLFICFIYSLVGFSFFPAFCCCCTFPSFFSTKGATKLAVLMKQQYLEWNSPTGAIFCSSLNTLIASLAREL